MQFVDDTEFFTKGEDSGIKMQETTHCHSSTHEATGGKEQKEKVMAMVQFFALPFF